MPSTESVVRLCYYVVVRTTLDISDEAYYIAKAIARDQNRSLGRVVGDLILQSSKGAKGASIKTFHLPMEGAAVLLGVGALLDMARTSVNVLGNCLASAVVARWKGYKVGC